MKNKKTLSISMIAMVAAIYTAITVALGPLSFGAIQVRVAEALIVVAILRKEGIYGVAFGCFIANIAGLMMGTNEIGMIDAVVGTTVTLVAAVLAYKLRDIRFKGIPYLSLFMPVILNAVFIALELVLVFHSEFNLNIYFMNFGSVFIGQFISCILLGGLLFKPLENVIDNSAL